MLYGGQGVPKDYKRAAKWYLKAAEQGLAVHQHGLGLMYYGGQGVPQDYEQAARWLSKAAKQGNAEAQSYLNMIYESGQGGGDLRRRGAGT